MVDDKVRLVKPGKTYFGAQGVAYGSGASRKTVGSEKICMNILPMPSGVHPVPHVHKDIETIAYLLEGECSVFHGENLENETLVKKGEQIFIPGNVPHTPYNLSDKECIWIVVHSSGDDQDELIPMPELENVLSYRQKSPRFELNKLFKITVFVDMNSDHCQVHISLDMYEL